MFHRHLLAAVLTIAATGCVSSSVLIGTARPPIDPALVRLYVDPPERFEKVAILESNSDASWAITAQQKTNKAIDRLKIEAAKYGANGVLIQGVGDQYAGSVGVANAWSNGNTAFGIGSSAANYRKAGSGMAIYVYDQGTAVTSPLSQEAAAPSPSAGAPAPASASPPPTGSAYDAALRYAAERGCSAGGVSVVSGNVYRASCPSTGRSLVIQCQGQSCKEVN
ncbi:hypothetical protein [Lysobacter antibioticus]|uniref:Lipoprotein n=1 Tax=Lysobacter antibioticus TaxID=84531 RepID=A0A0S2F7E0_LYSAN|nr:hypothetical protein [Lysobacter antibioticus]ALN79477.1 hypothetical protein LA76x_1320 [Lysobacter antibioticus]